MGKPVTASKTRLYVELAGTVCDTVNDYDALTWVRVAHIANYGEFGPQYQEITYTDVDEGVVHRLKGALDNGSLQVELNRNPEDAGQSDLIAGLDQYDNVNVKIELNDKPAGVGAKPTRFFIPAKVMSRRTNIGDGNRVVGDTLQLGIDGALLEGPRGT